MRTKTGIVSAAKMTGTVTVTVHRSVFHPLYRKRYPVSTKFLADSRGVDVSVGDLVVITECRPLSKRKHFRVTEIVKRAPHVSELSEEGALSDVMNPRNPGSLRHSREARSSDSLDSSNSSESSVSSSSRKTA